MKKLFFLLLLICSSVQIVQSQTDPDFEASFSRTMSDVIPPSPSVASLGTYGSYTTNTYIGMPNISIPIHTIKEGRLTWPISISYGSGGIKVSQISSWVGLGWTLQADGVISRTMVGEPDDGSLGLFDSVDPNTLDDCQKETAAKGNLDTQPDIYKFSFNGYSGQFFVNSDKTVSGTTIVDHPDKKINASLEFGTIDGKYVIVKWKIITPDGMIYHFGMDKAKNITAYEEMTRTNECGGFPKLDEYISAWHLLEIESPNQQSLATFEYDEVTEIYDREEYSTRGADFPLGNCYGNTNSSCESETTVETQKISKIKARNSIIIFSNTPDREDMENNNGAALSGIEIQNMDGDALKGFAFGSSYFSTDTDYRAKRLRLDSIVEYGGEITDANTFPPYRFSYDSNNLPRRDDKSQDYWGYHNGIYNTTLVPTVKISGETYTFGDREPRENSIAGANLTKIEYPTGGYTEFQWEPHEYGYVENNPISQSNPVSLNSTVIAQYNNGPVLALDVIIIDHKQDVHINYTLQANDEFMGYVRITDELINEVYWMKNDINSLTTGDEYIELDAGKYRIEALSESSSSIATLNVAYKELLTEDIGKVAGGLRIKKITDHDGIDQDNDVVRSYKYKMFSESSTRSSGVLVTPIPDYYYAAELYNTGGTCDYVIIASGNGPPIGYTKGSPVGYREVREYYGTNTENGYIDYTFTSPYEYQESMISGFPFPVNRSNDWKRGLPLSKTTYAKENENTFQLVEQELTTYKPTGYTDSTDSNSTFTVYGAKFGFRGQYGNKALPNQCGDRDGVAGAYYSYRPQWKDVASKTTKVYSSDYTNEAIENSITYSYDNKFRMSQQEYLASDGIPITIQYKYTYDYLPAYLDNCLLTCEANNIFNPIEIRTKKGATEQLIKLDQFNYTGSGKLQIHYKARILENSDFTFDQTNPFTTTPVYGFTYDIYDNLLFAVKKDDFPTQFLYGYNSTLPIAKIENVEEYKVFYTSFETDDQSGWIFDTEKKVLRSDYVDYTGTGDNIFHGYDQEITTSSPVSERSILSFWAKTDHNDGTLDISGGQGFYIISQTISEPNSDGWKYYEVEFGFSPGSSSTICISKLSANIWVDELRLHPVEAQMTTYTFNALNSITSTTDPNGQTSHYEYDDFGRLIAIRDFEGNLIKKVEYNYTNN